MRDVVILGWWAEAQRRIDFVHLLRNELGLELADAKRMLDASLDTREIIVVPISPSTRASAVARAMAAMGAEVRLLSGHAGPEDTEATAQLESMREGLRGFHEHRYSNRASQRAAAARICAELAVRHEAERGR